MLSDGDRGDLADAVGHGVCGPWGFLLGAETELSKGKGS